MKNTRDSLLLDPGWLVMNDPSSHFMVLQAKHLKSSIKCRISFDSGFQHENSFFVKHLLDLQPEARKLIHYMKIWLKHHNIQMSGYLITILVIFFLQQKHFLPAAQIMQRDCFPHWVGSELKMLLLN